MIDAGVEQDGAMMADAMNMLAEVTYDGELSGMAYAILAGMFLVIVGGLCWCFYKAMTSNNSEADEQLPDEV